MNPCIPDSTKDNNIIMMGIILLLLIAKSGMGKAMGAFHSTQNSGNFSWYIKWNGPFGFGPTGIFRTRVEGGPL